MACSAARKPAERYSSIMSSNPCRPAQVNVGPADVAARLARAIDECAAAARHEDGSAEPDFDLRLAAVWAILAAADPELAALAARYTEP